LGDGPAEDAAYKVFMQAFARRGSYVPMHPTALPLRKLPHADRETLLLIVLGELSYEEAATALCANWNRAFTCGVRVPDSRNRCDHMPLTRRT